MKNLSIIYSYYEWIRVFINFRVSIWRIINKGKCVWYIKQAWAQFYENCSSGLLIASQAPKLTKLLHIFWNPKFKHKIFRNTKFDIRFFWKICVFRNASSKYAFIFLILGFLGGLGATKGAAKSQFYYMQPHSNMQPQNPNFLFFKSLALLEF
jgi:hypothetical protein